MQLHAAIGKGRPAAAAAAAAGEEDGKEGSEGVSETDDGWSGHIMEAIGFFRTEVLEG